MRFVRFHATDAEGRPIGHLIGARGSAARQYAEFHYNGGHPIRFEGEPDD